MCLANNNCHDKSRRRKKKDDKLKFVNCKFYQKSKLPKFCDGPFLVTSYCPPQHVVDSDKNFFYSDKYNFFYIYKNYYLKNKDFLATSDIICCRPKNQATTTTTWPFAC